MKLFTLFLLALPVNGRLNANRELQTGTFPSYSQQCQDDAGPPFSDDLETFGPGRKYHFGSPAAPVLKNGELLIHSRALVIFEMMQSLPIWKVLSNVEAMGGTAAFSKTLTGLPKTLLAT